jgi:hypothetical protein
MKTTMNCMWCKNDYEYDYYPSQIARGRGKYCSIKCQRIAQGNQKKFWEKSSYEDQVKALQISYEKKVIKGDECWSWVGATKTGYGCVKANKINVGAHRISWMIHKGSIPKELWVLHKCDNKICSNPEHLFLGSRQDNIDDMVIKRRNKSGNTKLNLDQVVLIKKLLQQGDSVKGIATNYQVSAGTIYSIRNNISWRNI